MKRRISFPVNTPIKKFRGNEYKEQFASTIMKGPVSGYIFVSIDTIEISNDLYIYTTHDKEGDSIIIECKYDCFDIDQIYKLNIPPTIERNGTPIIRYRGKPYVEIPSIPIHFKPIFYQYVENIVDIIDKSKIEIEANIIKTGIIIYKKKKMIAFQIEKGYDGIVGILSPWNDNWNSILEYNEKLCSIKGLVIQDKHYAYLMINEINIIDNLEYTCHVLDVKSLSKSIPVAIFKDEIESFEFNDDYDYYYLIKKDLLPEPTLKVSIISQQDDTYLKYWNPMNIKIYDDKIYIEIEDNEYEIKIESKIIYHINNMNVKCNLLTNTLVSDLKEEYKKNNGIDENAIYKLNDSYKKKTQEIINDHNYVLVKSAVFKNGKFTKFNYANIIDVIK